MKKFDNYHNALAVLKQAPNQDLSNDYVQSGIINKFALQFELGWKLLKKLLSWEGDSTAATGSPRDILKVAYKYYDFLDEKTWLLMLRHRNTITHIYDAEEARDLVDAIIKIYLPAFCALEDGLVARYGDLLTRPDDEF